MRVGVALVVAGLGVAWIQPTAAPAATTVGSSLAASGTPAVCGPGCTIWNVAVPGAQVTAPGDGVVVRWRFRNSAGNGLRLRVLRNTSGATFKDVGSSARVDVAAASPNVSTFATRIPVKAGDFVAIDSSATVGVVGMPGAMYRLFEPALPDGGEAPSAGPVSNVEVLINADVEPDADRDGFGDESQDQCPTNASTAGTCQRPTAPSLRGRPCQGLTSKRLKSCRADERLKARLARCRKLKGKKARMCVRRTRALARCAKLKNKKRRAACRRKARRIK